MKKDKHRAWFTFHKGSFVGWLETHCPVQLLRHLLSHKYGSVINSFIFRAVQIVQSWNRKLGHTFYGLKAHNPLAKFDLSHQTSQGVTSGHFSKHLPCPWKWIHGFVSSAWRGQWFCRGHVPNSNIVTGLCSHLQVHPTVVLQEEDVDLFTICSFLFNPRQSPESSGSVWSTAPWAQWGAHRADTHTAQHKLESQAWQSFNWEAAILDTPQHQSDFAK